MGSVFTLLDSIGERPGMYALGPKPLETIETYLFGYYAALRQRGVVDDEPEMSHAHFAIWLRSVTGWSMSCGWAAAIRDHAPGAELETFLRYVARYRALRPVVVATATLRRGAVASHPRATRVEIVRYRPARIHFLRFATSRQRWNDNVIYTRTGGHNTSLRTAQTRAARTLAPLPISWRSERSGQTSLARSPAVS